MKICKNCKNFGFDRLTPICMEEMSQFVNDNYECEIECDKYDCRYIEYPLTINGIDNKFNKDNFSLTKCGKLVKIRPCSKEYNGKTFLGILLGDLPIDAYVTFDKYTKILKIGAMNNPAIFVPELKKIIYGCESWWGIIESEDELKDITDNDIDNVWYVKLLKRHVGKRG